MNLSFSTSGFQLHRFQQSRIARADFTASIGSVIGGRWKRVILLDGLAAGIYTFEAIPIVHTTSLVAQQGQILARILVRGQNLLVFEPVNADSWVLTISGPEGIDLIVTICTSCGAWSAISPWKIAVARPSRLRNNRALPRLELCSLLPPRRPENDACLASPR